MKKFYNYYLLIAFIALVNVCRLSAEDIQPTFEVRGFAQAEWAAPKLLSNGKSNITVSFSRYSFEQGSNLWVNGDYYDNISYIRMNDSSNESNGGNIENNIDYSSYILFEIPAGYPAITKIELIAYSFGAGNFFDTSNLIESYSKTDNSTAAYKLNNPTNTSEPWGTEYYVNGPSDDIIGNGNSITHLVGRYDATYTGIDPIPVNSEDELQAIRYIRINWSSAEFGLVSSALGRGRPLALFGMNIYTNQKDNPTSIEDVNEDQYKLTYRNNLVSMNEESGVAVYNLSGSIVYQAKAVKSVDLNHLANGLYIVKAQSLQTGKIQTEKINKK